MTSFLNYFLETFTYFALIAVLVAAGLGVPIPEDIPLITSGYLCNQTYSPVAMKDSDSDGQPDKVPNLYCMIAAGMIGVLAGDTIVFYIGRKGIDSNNFVARHLRKVLHSRRREKAERHFARHGQLTVFAGRFMPGFRSLIFAMAGMAKMSYTRFIVIDVLAASISVPAFIILGHALAAHFQALIFKVNEVKHIVGPIVLVLTIGAIALYLVRRRRNAALRAAEDAGAVLEAAHKRAPAATGAP